MGSHLYPSWRPDQEESSGTYYSRSSPSLSFTSFLPRPYHPTLSHWPNRLLASSHGTRQARRPTTKSHSEYDAIADAFSSKPSQAPNNVPSTQPLASLTPNITPLTPSELSPPAPGERVNATFITLARNSDIWEIARSIRQVEDRFNRNYNYDWVFLNDKPFDDTFKKVTTSLVSGKTHYGEIPVEHWSFPSWIDQKKAEA